LDELPVKIENSSKKLLKIFIYGPTRHFLKQLLELKRTGSGNRLVAKPFVPGFFDWKALL
jgi:hypothetical protein